MHTESPKVNHREDQAQVHLEGNGNYQRLRASRWVKERLRSSRSHSCATRKVPRDGPCESNDEFNETTTKLISQSAELDTLK